MTLFSLKRLSVLSLSCILLIGASFQVSAASLSPGSLIKGSTSAVYYYTAAGKRMAFPQENVFKTWYSDFSSVKQISDAELALIPLGPNATYRPGTRLIKITTDPKVYAVAQHSVLRWIQNETVAIALYGSNWNQHVDDISDAFFVNYTVGTPITVASDFAPAQELANARIDAATTPLPIHVPSTADVTFTIDTTSPRTPISPYIYGSNEFVQKSDGTDRLAQFTLYRQGGNRYTGYNWENNASNAGIDYGPNSSDTYLSDSTVPGFAVTHAIEQAQAREAASLVTVPIVDYVAADTNGLVTSVASDQNPRWVRNHALTPGGALPATPNLADRSVYQDQFVHFIAQRYPHTFFSLDNEPALWPSTHPLIHPQPTTFAEMADRTTAYATMIKQQAPESTVFGAVAYGYYEYVALQGAPDQQGRDYLDFFLQTAQAAEKTAGQRVVDVLDLHWYPEAQGGGQRITNGNSPNPSPAEFDARVQAPRSLWDTTYIEKSWITDVTSQPLQLLPWLKQKIATEYPGTKLSFSEYNYGGAHDISGAIAQADVLGIFGREGVFAATFWPLINDPTSFIYGGFDMFLNYDGKGHNVGDLSLTAQTTDTYRTSVYAMTRSTNTKELTVIAINKTNTPLSISADMLHAGTYTSAQAYTLTAAAPVLTIGTVPTLNGNRLTTILPARSITTFILN
jgi:hypothetical protein